MQILFLLICLLCCTNTFGAYTEFYVDSTSGNQLNSGSSSGSPILIATNGNWSTTTNKFTFAGGTDLSAVATDTFASVYLDAATVGVYIARITAVDNAAKTVTLSTSAKIGTAPTAGTTGRSIRIGGALQGPVSTNSYSVWPLTNTGISSAVNSAGSYPRFNLKGTFTLNGTAIALASASSVTLQGYSSVIGDGGKASIVSAGIGAVITCGGASTSYYEILDLDLDNSGVGTTGVASIATNASVYVERVRVYRSADSSFVSSGPMVCIECEAANPRATGGFVAAGTSSLHCERCIAHHAENGVSGFSMAVSTPNLVAINCISHANAGAGFRVNGTCRLQNCVAVGNGVGGTDHGIDLVSLTGSSIMSVGNCISSGNTGYGFNAASNSARNILVRNFATYNNTSGAMNYTAPQVRVVNQISLSRDPYVNLSGGDFRTRESALRGTARGGFLQRAGNYSSPVVRTEDIGISISNPWFN